VSSRFRIALAWFALLPALGFAAPVRAQDPRTSSLSMEVQIAVYATVLRFYDPPRGQVRWIESRMVGDAEEAGVLEPALVSAVLERLGDDFRPWVEEADGSGGRLRVSALHAVAPDTFRVTVSYQHRTPYFEGPRSGQSFLVGRADDRWRILARGAASLAETP
jgi:hypothetical protein